MMAVGVCLECGELIEARDMLDHNAKTCKEWTDFTVDEEHEARQEDSIDAWYAGKWID